MRSAARSRRVWPDGEPAGVPARLRQGALRRFAASRLYRHTLIGRAPEDLLPAIGQRWPGEARRGTAIIEGNIELAGESVRDPKPRWSPPVAGAEWLAAWYGFDWLADLTAAGEPGCVTARELVTSWIADNTASRGLAWRSDVVATRVCAWLAHIDEIAGRGQHQTLRRSMLASLAAQVRHLGRTAIWERAGEQRLRALKGLIAGMVALGTPPSRLSRALRALDRQLALQILPDGGHRSRSPLVQLHALQDLVDIRAVLRAAQIETPKPLNDAIERMAPVLRLFRHGDRRLALFNDSVEADGVLMDLVLTRSEAKGPAPAHVPDSGFCRMQAGGSIVLADTGGPPPPGFDDHAHAGTLSFEMSHGGERIIVNCGAYRGCKPDWWRVARTSAAHSVLVVADTNAVEIRADGVVGRSPALVSGERDEQEGRQWISATHDGYRTRFGLTYARQLFLAADGLDLRGEEQLNGRPGAAFAVRFHLHPAVQASLVPQGDAALLRLPSGSSWRLRAAGAEMSLGESIYLGSGEARRTQQVVLSGAVPPGGAAVRWALRRERPEPAEAAAD